MLYESIFVRMSLGLRVPGGMSLGPVEYNRQLVDSWDVPCTGEMENLEAWSF